MSQLTVSTLQQGVVRFQATACEFEDIPDSENDLNRAVANRFVPDLFCFGFRYAEYQLEGVPAETECQIRYKNFPLLSDSTTFLACLLPLATGRHAIEATFFNSDPEEIVSWAHRSCLLLPAACPVGFFLFNGKTRRFSLNFREEPAENCGCENEWMSICKLLLPFLRHS